MTSARIRIGGVALIVLLLGAAVLYLHDAGARRAPDWTGRWRTRWRDGGATLTLTQTGDLVSGSYSPYRGRIEGRVEGRRLTGRWIQPRREGAFTYHMSSDGRTFAGRFASGEWWTGARVAGAADLDPPPPDLSSPRAACRSFLLSMEKARAGDNQAYEGAMACLRIEDADALPGERIRVAEALFDVLDRLTFRIWKLPEASGGKTAQVTLLQAGTELEFDLLFARDPEGDWRIVPPPENTLSQKSDELTAARFGGRAGLHPHPELSSPRHTLRTFLENVKRWDEGGSGRVLSTLVDELRESPIPAQQAWLLADSLHGVLDRSGYVVWQEIPDAPEFGESYLHFQHPEGVVELVPVRIETETVWKFSERTLRSILDLYLAIENAPVEGALATADEGNQPLFFRLRSLAASISPQLLRHPLGIANFQLVALLVILAGGVVLAFVSTRLLRAALRLRFREDRQRLAPDIENRLLKPLSVVIASGVLMLSVAPIGLPFDFLTITVRVLNLVLAAGATLAAHNLVVVLGAYFYRRAQRTPGFVDEILVSLTAGAVRLVVICAGLFVMADLLALPYQSVLAGLGIGGLAIAIAARDTLANFFGSVVLLTDRPFGRGDLIEVGGRTGTVEHVGLRSTRIRTIDDSQVVIPNAQLANEKIDNRGHRRARLLRTRAGLAYDTPRQRIGAFTGKVRDLIRERYPHRASDSFVGVLQLGDSAIEIEILCFVEAASLSDERAARQELLLDIRDVAREVGVEFAYPTRTVHLRPAGAEPSDLAAPDGP